VRDLPRTLRPDLVALWSRQVVEEFEQLPDVRPDEVIGHVTVIAGPEGARQSRIALLGASLRSQRPGKGGVANGGNG